MEPPPTGLEDAGLVAVPIPVPPLPVMPQLPEKVDRSKKCGQCKPCLNPGWKQRCILLPKAAPRPRKQQQQQQQQHQSLPNPGMAMPGALPLEMPQLMVGAVPGGAPPQLLQVAGAEVGQLVHAAVEVVH